MLATLVVLRLQLPRQTLVVLYGVDRATITRAVHEVRPLLAAGGFAVPGQPGLRLRTLARPGPGRMHDQTAVTTTGRPTADHPIQPDQPGQHTPT